MRVKLLLLGCIHEVTLGVIDNQDSALSTMLSTATVYDLSGSLNYPAQSALVPTPLRQDHKVS